MKIHILVGLAILGGSFAVTDVRGVNIGLFEYAYNIDGSLTTPPGVPAGVNDAAFDYATGLGTISFSTTTPGSHFVGFFVDHEIDEIINTFFNEIGTAVGAAPAGLSWEIDEPGFVFGDIYSNFVASGAAGSVLGNSTGVPPGSPDDVSMALGWNFALVAGANAVINFNLSTAAPAGGFYLVQTDPDSNASVYFSSTLGVSVPDNGSAVPDNGSSLLLLLLALSAMLFWHRIREQVT